MKIDVLGTKYDLTFSTEAKDKMLKNCDGYCDSIAKKLVVDDCTTDCDFTDPSDYVKKNIRHEIIHAFMFESGLGANWQHPRFGHEETVVDWFAVQLPKLLKAFETADAL